MCRRGELQVNWCLRGPRLELPDPHFKNCLVPQAPERPGCSPAGRCCIKDGEEPVTTLALPMFVFLPRRRAYVWLERVWLSVSGILAVQAWTRRSCSTRVSECEKHTVNLSNPSHKYWSCKISVWSTAVWGGGHMGPLKETVNNNLKILQLCTRWELLKYH